MCALAAWGVVLSASAMNRWEALSMLETGDDDSAVGRCGEISRYQIRAELWPGGNPQNARAALSVARNIMQTRVARFQETHGRSPTNFEFYVLWNAPAEIDHPVPCVAERARRYANLVERETHQAQAAASFRKTTNAS
ncbi:MAG TPA: hypothetical protein VMA35_14120 [Candidatus Sulfopaludibacter sp.]|nr:hypothetical protein [Candidatus Sulfopaludibacter sp.]